VATDVLAPAWHAYAQATRADHFAWWCEQHCVQSIDRFAGRPLVLEDWQVGIMGEALAELEEDRSYWQTVVLVVPKKNGKTSLLAAYALYHLCEDEGAPEILLAAATDKQAGRLFDAAVRFVKSSPVLSGQLVIREHEGQITQVDGFGVLHRLSADSGAAAGFNPSAVVADELAEWTTPRRRRTWADIATAGELAREAARVFVISHGGEPQERAAGILGLLIDQNEAAGELERVHRALTVSRDHRSRTLVYNYDARTEDPMDLEAISAANPASWITDEKLAALAASPKLTPGRFLQLHGCVWTASEGGYIDLETWRGLTADEPLAAGADVLVGFRGGEACAMVACDRASGMLHTLGVWEDTQATADVIQDAMGWAAKTYRVAAVFASATPEWATIVDGWRSDMGKRRVVDVDIARPSARTAQITDRFAADVHARRIRHDGNRRLEAHVAAARIARARSLPYLVADARTGVPVAGAHAALLAWEARAILGVGRQRSRTPVSI